MLMRTTPVLLAVALLTGQTLGADVRLDGAVKIDGSSTVAPIMMAAAEMFQAEQPKVRVTVGISGTGGGFKKFLADRPNLRIDINDASRIIKQVEKETAAKLGVKYLEIPIALDGIAVVVHPKNTACAALTVAELKRIWEPDSQIKNWKDIRPGFPDLRLKLYGPGTDSGTFDYFTEAVVGKEKSCRGDFTASEDDNVLVQGVEGDPGALGYFGFSYYEANKAKLKLLAIDGGDGKPVAPNIDGIRAGTYKPLSRTLYVYVNTESLRRPDVGAFLTFFLTSARKIVEHPMVNYVALPAERYAEGLNALKKAAGGP